MAVSLCKLFPMSLVTKLKMYGSGMDTVPAERRLEDPRLFIL